MSIDLDTVNWALPTTAGLSAAGEAWLRGPRDIVRITGPDALSYLHSQCSQRLDDLDVGERRWSLLLSPAGEVVAVIGVRRVAGSEVEIDADVGAGRAVMERLQRFLLRTAAEIERVDSDTAPDAEVDGLRITGGWPRHGAEIRESGTLAAELGLNELAVSFTKGCYPGQELVERMDSRGAQAPWRLVVVECPGDVGDVVVHNGAEVGVVTSSSGAAVLARVRRSVIADSAPSP